LAHVKLKVTRAAVDRAGRTLLNENSSEQELDAAWDAIANWRALHGFPLNTIAADLHQKVKRVDKSALVVRRLKRTRSMLAKLSKKASMRLTQMQDIGGCRAVVDTISQVERLRDMYARSRSMHALVSEDNYIASPKSSGYRSVHLVYKFQSKAYPQYDKLLFEVQLRTSIQHAWATAVETVSAVLGQALKASEGEARWLEYFQLAAAALEYIERGKHTIYHSITKGQLARKLQNLSAQLDVSAKLSAYRNALRATENPKTKNAAYFLLFLVPDQQKLQIIPFTRHNADVAFREYEKFERLLPLHPPGRQLSLFPELADYSGAQAVLVGAESFKSIRESYPNYYLDTGVFLEKVQGFIRRFRRAA
jgi:ppGpp synthetase/RelA/SpoT-type nucleotidyltranferase